MKGARDKPAHEGELQALREKLVKKHQEGVGYLRFLQPGTEMIAQTMLGRRISTEDLAIWHTEVQLLLKPHPELLRIYNQEPFEPLATQSARRMLSAATGGPEAEKLRHGLSQLKRVIDLC